MRRSKDSSGGCNRLVMRLRRRLVAQKIAVGPRVEQLLVALPAPFAHGERHRAVGPRRLQRPHDAAEPLVGEIRILPALQHHRAEAHAVARLGAEKNFFLRQPVAAGPRVGAADAAVEAVVFAEIGKFDQPADVHVPPVDGLARRPRRAKRWESTSPSPQASSASMSASGRQRSAASRSTRRFNAAIADKARIGGLDAHARQTADLAGKGADGVLRRIHGHADDVDGPSAGRKPHAPDDVFVVGVQQGVDLPARAQSWRMMLITATLVCMFRPFPYKKTPGPKCRERMDGADRFSAAAFSASTRAAPCMQSRKSQFRRAAGMALADRVFYYSERGAARQDRGGKNRLRYKTSSARRFRR